MPSPSPAGSRRSRSSDDDEGPLHNAQIAVDSFHCHSSRLRVIGSLQPVTFAELVFKLLFSSTIFNNNVLIFLTLLQANQRRRRQQRRGLGASAVSERSAEDANLLSIPNPPPRRNVTHGVMSERYHLGGRVETDTVAMAAARQDQAGIQRRHRLERRQGDDPSQTPPFTSLVARHEVSQGTEEPPPQLPINPPLPDQPRLGRGRPPIPDDPIDPAQPRRGRGRLPIPDDPIDPTQPRRGRGRPSFPDDSIDPPDDPIDPAQPRPGRPRLPDAPPSDRVAAGDAMSAAHWARVQSFRQALYGEVKECCSQCHEEWFNMQLSRDNVCHRCQLKDKDKEPPLLSDANEMDPGEVPEHLPALSQVEEMLIARVHLHLEAKRIRGLQYQYTGHTVCFMNRIKLMCYDPRFPQWRLQKWTILICRPASSRISVCRPALKCIVNGWVEPVVMVKPVPVCFISPRRLLFASWNFHPKFASSCSVQLM